MKKGKVDAERKWQLAVRRGVDPGVLLAAAERYRDDPTREPAFTLWPKTWLHGGHWQDEGPARATATTVTSSRQSVTRVTAGMTEVDHQAMEGLFR